MSVPLQGAVLRSLQSPPATGMVVSTRWQERSNGVCDVWRDCRTRANGVLQSCRGVFPDSTNTSVTNAGTSDNPIARCTV